MMTFFGKLKKMMNPFSSTQVAKEEDTEKVEPGEGVRGRPKIHVLATGGTIAGRLVSTGPRYRAGVLGFEALLDAVPALRGLADYSGEQVANIGSQDMDESLWLKLAHRVNELLASPDVDGVVITHGTDTLEETACFLDLTVRNPKPVVLVGAIRPVGALGADGPVNLLDAVTVAVNPSSVGRGVLVVMHGSLFEARDVTKVSSSALPAFAAPNSGPLGQLIDGRVYYGHRTGLSPKRPVFDISNLDKLPQVDIVYGYAGASTLPVKALVDAGCRGIVSAGVGNGNLHRDVLAALANASGRGVVVVRASRIPSGLTLRNVEVDDNRFGFVAAGALNPQKARVLLQLVLTRARKPEEVQKAFDNY
ncbi:MAG: type II asparaginase [Betaproteobacteria bacterium]|nr:type II asparaginase [Betaproteobacteria bacterium]